MLIAIEGIDGSGKGTQAELLYQRCAKEGISATRIGFPQYGRTPFAEAIKDYLNGAYGGLRDVHPKLAALLFAGDRFATKPLIEAACRDHEIIIFDRYVASNLAYQAAKLHESEREPFIAWVASIEYGVYHLPPTDLTVYLDVPVDTAQKLVERKSPDGRTYTTLKADIHEEDAAYLLASKQVYDLLARKAVGGRWETIRCVEADGRLRPTEEIAEELWHLVRT